VSNRSTGAVPREEGEMMKPYSGARYEIAVDGTPRSHRDRKDMAIEAARHLKTKQPHSEITVRDLETGEVTAVKHPLQK
jgi:hypothetical protein